LTLGLGAALAWDGQEKTMKKHRTVLLVDDDENVRDSLDKIIEGAGHTCFVAENGPQALAMLRKRAVHAIITDHDMPGMDGVELLKLVSTRYPQIARILITGRADAQTAVRAINVGQAYRYLNKPCRSAELLTTLHFAFEVSDAEVESRRLGDQLRVQTAMLAEIRTRFPGVVEEIEARMSALSA
jgi:DNA-binding NtrC family response regulator